MPALFKRNLSPEYLPLLEINKANVCVIDQKLSP